MVIGHLEISTYVGITAGAIHWYCTIYINDNGKYLESKKLERQLTSKEIIDLNREDHERGYLVTHKAGDKTEGFNSKKEAIQAGITYFKSKYKGILFDSGMGGISAWKKVIVCPDSLKSLAEQMNNIANQFQSLNGYEGTELELAGKLDAEWVKLYDKLLKNK